MLIQIIIVLQNDIGLNYILSINSSINQPIEKSYVTFSETSVQ